MIQDNLLMWIARSIQYGSIIMYGSLGETLTEKSGNLNLGVPGIMYLGAFAGFVSVFGYEQSCAAAEKTPSAVVCLLIGMLCAFAASALGGLLYSFLTISLRANQNVTGLALTTFGTGFSNFMCTRLFTGTYTKATFGNEVFNAKLIRMQMFSGKTLVALDFLAILAILTAVVLYLFLNKTRAGLNLRAVGENPATADAAGINVTKYKYLATVIGAGISGMGGIYYVLAYNSGIWATTDNISALGWLAVALVIFTTWKPLNAIWGAYLFGMLYWLYNFLPNMLSIKLERTTSLYQMLPYVVTIVVLVAVSLRRRRESQPPASLGLAYFREDR